MNEGEFIKYKADELKLCLELFPGDFIKDAKGKRIQLPDQLLVPGKEFFGSMEITTPNGTPWYLSDNLSEGKYIIYARQNGNKEVVIPNNSDVTASAVLRYEQYLDLMMKEIGKDFRKRFPDNDSVNAVSAVFKLLNLVRY